MVVTIDVPTLLPMFRVKFTNPATALLLSSVIPMYAAVVAGTKIKPIGKYWPMRSNVAEEKLINKSILCVEIYIPRAKAIQPDAIR